MEQDEDSGDMKTNEWELSKENVQPLKKGRILSELTTGLQQSCSETTKLREQKQSFEYKLRMYDDDDPLSVWNSYVKWIQQNFPSGGPETGLQTLLENCITRFKDVVKYKNDERFIDIWLNLLVFQAEPLELFNFMMNKGIGIDVAAFYSAWADELESIGNYKRAEAIYQAGLSKMAYPVQNLRSRYADFQQRARKAAGMEAASGLEVVEPQRQYLVGIKGQGKHKIAGNDRQPIKMVKQTKDPLAVSNDQRFTIFSDEGNIGNNSAVTAHIKSDWVSVPKQGKLQVENMANPAQWTKSKMDIKKSVASAVPISDVSKMQNPNFSVHMDRNVPDTPSGKSLNIGVLSERKAEKSLSAHDIINRVMDSPGKKAMYNKAKVYGGAVEISFEEIRARRFFERKRAGKEMELMIRKQVEEQNNYSVKQMKELQEQVQRLTVQLLQQKQGHPPRQPEESNSTGHDEQSVPSTIRASPPIALKPSSPVLPYFQESKVISEHHANRNLGFDQDSRKSIVKTPTLSMVAEDSKLEIPNISSDECTPNKSAGPNLSGDRTSDGMTITSKEAMHMIQGMFNHTLKADDLGLDHYESGILEDSRFAIKSDVQSTRKCSAFEIFMDSDDKGSSGEDSVAFGQPEPKQQIYNDGAFKIFNDLDDDKKTIVTAAPFRIPADEVENRSRHNNSPTAPGTDLEGLLQIDEEMTFAPSMGSTQKFPGIPQHQLDEEMTFNPCYSSTKTFPALPHGISERIFHDEKQQPQTTSQQVTVPESTMRFAVTTVGCNLSTIAEGSNEKSGSSGNHDTTNHFCGHTIPASHLDTNKTGHTTTSSGFPDVRSIMGHIDDDLDKLIGLESTSKEKNEESSFGALQNVSSRQSDNSVRMEAFVKDFSLANSVNESRTSVSCLGSNRQHAIDTSQYTPSHATEDLLSHTIAIDPGLNPFADDVTEDLLARLEVPITAFPGYIQIDDFVPNFPDKGVDAILLGDEIYHIERKIGSGAFASVYLASKLNNDDFDDVSGTDDKRAIKVQQPACPWEFYIISTLHGRLGENQVAVDIRPSIMTVDKALFYTNGSCFINQFHPHGSLLNLANEYKATGKRPQEDFVAYIVVELLYLAEALITCGMIHGDIKPDNVLFIGLPSLKKHCDSMPDMMGYKTQSIKLMDFGRGIDMKLFSEGTNFMAKVETEGFQCIEMQTDKPWTHQTDLFGIVGTIHVLIFNQYMNVHNVRGRWKTTGKIPRRWDAPRWDRLFDTMLNIENCDSIPDIAEVRRPFEEFLLSSDVSDCFRSHWPLK